MTPLVAAILNWISDWAVPDSLRQDPDVYRQAKRVAVFDVAFGFWTVLFAIIYVALGSPLCALLTLSYIAWISASLMALKRGNGPALCGNVLCLGGCTTLVLVASVNGGSAAPPLVWLTCAPVVAILTSGIAWGALWMAVSLSTIGLFAVAEACGVSFPNELAPSTFAGFTYAVFAGLIVCQFILAWVRVGIEERALVALHETNQRLAHARKELDTLQKSFGFSLEEWAKIHREKAALERALRYQIERDMELDDDADEEELDAEDLSEIESVDRDETKSKKP